jgi:PAS domain S-box-containing protein
METVAKRTGKRLIHDNAPPGVPPSITMGVITFDLRLKVTGWNKQAEKIFGYTSNEAIGNDIHELVISNEKAIAIDAWKKKVLKSKYSISAFSGNSNKKGEAICCNWFTTPYTNEKNEVKGFVSLIEKIYSDRDNEDRSDLKEVSKAFNENNSFNLILNYETQEFEYINRIIFNAFSLVTNNSFEKSTDILKFIPYSEHFRLIRHFRTRLVDKKNVNIFFHLSLSNSMLISLQATGNLLDLNNKRLFVLNIRVLKNDKPHRKQSKSDCDYERRLFHSDLDNLQNKNRLELLGDLTAGVVHELNQPLGVMKIILESIRQKSESGNLTQEYLEERCEMAQGSVERISELIDEIRIFRKEVRGSDIKKVNLAKPLHKVLDLINLTLASNKIKLTTTIQNDLPVIVANEKWLTIIISNLLTNAKYSLVKKSEQLKDPSYVKEIKIKAWYDDERVFLQVTDNGLGIKKKHLSNLFDPYFTTKGNEGSGLGLAIVKNYMKELNGSIKVDTQENLFATFILAFPRID